MHEAIGDKLDGKIACVGLHGDYEAGLQFIRDGKLAQMRKLYNNKPESFAEEPFVTSTASSVPQAIPTANQTYQEDSPTLSPLSTHLVTPRDAPSPLPAMGDPRIVQGGSSPSSYSSEPSEEHMPASKETSHPRSAAREAPVPGIGSGPTQADRPLHFIFLGSSLGNFERPSAAPFLKSLPLRTGDTLLLGLDGRPTLGKEGSKKVEVAYNDPAGHTKRFEEHGWEIVKQELGVKGNAEFVGRYNEELGESLWEESLIIVDADSIFKTGRHEAYFRSKERQTIHLPTYDQDITIEEGELLNIEWSYKVSLLSPCFLFFTSPLSSIRNNLCVCGHEADVWLWAL